MTKYVTDLLAVKPDEIQHEMGWEVLGIYYNGTEDYPERVVFVVCRQWDGTITSDYYLGDGRYVIDDKTSRFTHKTGGPT